MAKKQKRKQKKNKDKKNQHTKKQAKNKMAKRKQPSFQPQSAKSSTTGEGGELHQHAHKNSILTTQQGTPVSDDQNTLRVGPRGPALLEDTHFREKLFHFDHERIPERVVHARGFGVHGYFENYHSLSDITCAHLFQKARTRTPAFVRFSTVAGNKGSVDLARDVRGFAVKLYTQEGNWDIVGNNIPVFFIQDAIKFPDLIHAVKVEPDRGFPQAQRAHDNFWDFISLTPESMNMVMWIMSDRTIPRSFRFMEGFGVHTFRLINSDGNSTYVKFHWKPSLGLQSVVWDEALKINGADPDFHRRDMWNAIQSKDYPEWELGMQLFDDKFAEEFEFDVLDATKIIPEEQVPVRTVGKLVLDRCVDNFFAETEQVAFCTQNIVPGIDFTNDPLLQGRNFSYLDTQLKRLGGPNFTHIPINSPKCEVNHFQQDGHMTMHARKGRANYEPNSISPDGGPRESQDRGLQSFPEKVSGSKLRQRPSSFSDHYSQARQFYISQTETEQNHIVDALSFELSKVEKEDIRLRMVSHLKNIDSELAQSVAHNLGVEKMPPAAQAACKTREDLQSSDALSILKNSPKSFKGRKLGILVSERASENVLKSLAKAFKEENVQFAYVNEFISSFKTDKNTSYPVHERIGGGPSVLFDAVAIVIAPSEVEKYASMPPVRDFITDALTHKKYIACAEQCVDILSEVGASAQTPGVHILKNSSDYAVFLKSCRRIRCWERQPSSWLR